MGEFWNKAAAVIGQIGKEMGETAKNAITRPKETTLTAAKLRELKWMSPRQLSAVYGGKAKIHIDDDPAAYKELKWMSEEQLKAIFGEERDSI